MSFSFNTVFDHAIFVFDIVAWDVTIKFFHRPLSAEFIAFAGVVEVGFGDEPD